MALHRKMPKDLAEQREEKRENMRGADEELRRSARNTFSSGDGKVMLDILIQTYYDGKLDGADAHQTYRLLGQRDVVKFIMDLLKEN